MHTEQYDEGYIAGEANVKSTSNPYKYGTSEYQEWQAGYTAAQVDFYAEASAEVTFRYFSLLAQAFMALALVIIALVFI